MNDGKPFPKCRDVHTRQVRTTRERPLTLRRHARRERHRDEVRAVAERPRRESRRLRSGHAKRPDRRPRPVGQGVLARCPGPPAECPAAARERGGQPVDGDRHRVAHQGMGVNGKGRVARYRLSVRPGRRDGDGRRRPRAERGQGLLALSRQKAGYRQEQRQRGFSHEFVHRRVLSLQRQMERVPQTVGRYRPHTSAKTDCGGTRYRSS